jgi:DNA-binding transcriptional MerR regulator
METYTRSELAKLVGVNKETLRYYETRKLIEPPRRSRSGYRLYRNEDANRIRFIKNAQKLGFSLDEISELLSLQVAKKAGRETVLQKARDKKAEIDNRIEKLNNLKEALDRLIETCETSGNNDECPILTFLQEGRFLTDEK